MPDANQLRRQLEGLHRDLARESKKDSAASIKAAKARERAAKSSSSSTTRMKLREAEREEGKALDARKKRANIDSKIADLTKRLHTEEARVATEQARSLQRLQGDLERQQATAARELQDLVSSPTPGAASEAAEFDFFISHATPDKEAIAKPLGQALEARNAKVWLDDTQIRVGDSLRQKIDDGLRRSRFGIVVLSRSFLRGREWTDKELNGLFVREEQAGEPRILPIWHDVTKNEVAAYSPILADKAALKTADLTIEEIVELLLARLGKPEETEERPESSAGESTVA